PRSVELDARSSFPTRRSSDLTPPPTWGWLCSCSACPARDGRRRVAGLPPHRRTLGVGAAVPPVVGGHPLAMGPDHCSRRSQLVGDRKSTRLNSSHVKISYAVF